MSSEEVSGDCANAVDVFVLANGLFG